MPADKAIDLLALQCDLRVVRRGTAFMLTSKDHANELFGEKLDKERQLIEVEQLRKGPAKPPEKAPEPKPEPAKPEPAKAEPAKAETLKSDVVTPGAAKPAKEADKTAAGPTGGEPSRTRVIPAAGSMPSRRSQRAAAEAAKGGVAASATGRRAPGSS